MLELFEKLFLPTTKADFTEAKKAGKIQDTDWVSGVETVGMNKGKHIRIKNTCMAILILKGRIVEKVIVTVTDIANVCIV